MVVSGVATRTVGRPRSPLACLARPQRPPGPGEPPGGPYNPGLQQDSHQLPRLPHTSRRRYYSHSTTQLTHCLTGHH